MAFLTFKGGIHPYDGKELSKDKPITDYLPKQELVYPLSQHIGAPAKSIVERVTMYWPGRKLLRREVLFPHPFTHPFPVP